MINFMGKKSFKHLFVNILDAGWQGCAIRVDRRIGEQHQLYIVMREQENKSWSGRLCRVVWRKNGQEVGTYVLGLRFLETDGKTCQKSDPKRFPAEAGMDFFVHNRLIQTLADEGVCSFLNCLLPRKIKRGARFITQGEKGDSLFIIQKGLCSIQVQDENDRLITAAQRREGEVVGEMALLTGEARMANVVAESDMILWELSRDAFDKACLSHPDIREFLTELLTNRLENSTVTAVRHVGRYVMTHLIGQGGWSFVYRGKHKRLKMPVAIKMMKHNKAMDEDFIESFRKEGELIARLNHENIVNVYDIEELYRTIFIVMEHLEGESLEALLERKGGLPFSRALAFLTQIASGLAFAHDHDIIHRDIKPANVFILKDDRIKLVDFGLACAPGEEDFEQTGTVHYMPPEQIEGDPVDHRSDIYSFGILAYEVFTGKKPFLDDNLMAVMRMQKEMEIPDPRILVPDLPERAANLILKSTSKSPGRRHDSMHEIIEELSLIAGSLKEGMEIKSAEQREVTVLLVSHGKEQNLSLNRLLDHFSRQAEKLGFSVNIAGKTQIF